jgi:hypothetical protein
MNMVYPEVLQEQRKLSLSQKFSLWRGQMNGMEKEYERKEVKTKMR